MFLLFLPISPIYEAWRKKHVKHQDGIYSGIAIIAPNVYYQETGHGLFAKYERTLEQEVSAVA